uniref:SH3 domain-containing protein n=1 Tax=Schistocephalus solidus TaxID=70667 RepID=A0A0X3Q183_SCHSO
MSSIKAKLGHGGNRKQSKASFSTNDGSQQLDVYRDFFGHYENKMMNMLQPSIQGRAKVAIKNIAGKNGKHGEYHYEEAKFHKFLSKLANGLTSSFGSALSSISSTYKQVEDLKKERENELKSQIFNPNMREIVKELENLSQQEKVVEQQNAKVASAQRQTTKVGDAQSLEKLEAAKRSLRENQDKLNVSMEAFLRTEPERIAILQKAAEIECEYYRKAAEAFQELQNELTGIKERATTSPVVSNRTDYYMESPRQEFAFSTVVGAPDPVPQSNGSQEPCCRALHTFEAELDEDLPFHENQIIKLIEKVDDDWYFGELNGRRGHFPANFVEVIVPLP